MTSSNKRRVLITAGAGGIGLEVAKQFLETGAEVFVCDVSDDALAALAVNFPQVHAIKADVSQENEVEAMFKEVRETMGGLDVLVNNAGIAGPTGPLETMSLADWNRTFDVNVVGQFLCARAAIPLLREGNAPAIINMSSAAGHLGMPRRAAYSASKWAVIGLTKTLAIELGPEGIRVNAVLPGAVDGPRIQAVIRAKAESLGRPYEEILKKYEEQASMARMVTEEDIANTVVFAASTKARSVTGQSLVVDCHTQFLN